MNTLAVNPSDLDLDAMLQKLSLANTRGTWRQMVDRAETEDWSCRDFLAVVVAEEVAHREQTRIQRSVRAAGFPFLKTIDEFDFSLRSSLRRGLIGSYLGPELVSEGRNLILLGKTGRGKTHLAVSIAYRAIQNGSTAKFITAALLIEELSEASRHGKLRQALKAYTSPGVLIIDEVGYLNYGPDAANVLFHVVNDRHILGRPIIFTTNKSPFSDWGEVLHDRDLAEAIVDRILERGRLIILDGPSARTRHLNTSEAHDSNEKAAIISGMDRPEFPESTYEIIEEDVSRFRQEKRGRPNAGTTYKRIMKKKYHVKWKPRKDNIEFDSRSDGMFPLITNCEDFSLKDILDKYKFQPRLEKRHEQFKSVFEVVPILLKSVTRIEGLLFIYFMTLLVEALIEREIRLAMKRDGLNSVPIYPEARECELPTTERILELYDDMEVHRLWANGKLLRVFRSGIDDIQRQLLTLAGMSMEEYTKFN